MNGFVKIHRQITEWEWWDDKKTSRLWFYLLLKVNFKSNRWHGIDLEPGQFITSLQSLSIGTGLSQMEIRNSLKKLTSTGEIKEKTTNKCRIITVCNWDIYQSQEDENDKQGTSKEQTKNKQRTNKEQAKNKQRTNKEQTKNNSVRRKEGKEGEEGEEGEELPEVAAGDSAQSQDLLFSEPVYSKSRCTEDQCVAYALDRGFKKIDGQAVFASFEASGWKLGTGHLIKDWKAAFRTREMNKWLPSQKDGESGKFGSGGGAGSEDDIAAKYGS